jgi:hypothetical protein
MEVLGDKAGIKAPEDPEVLAERKLYHIAKVTEIRAR